MVRPALPSDVPSIIALIRELAEYERSLAHVEVDEVSMRSALFGENPAVFAHVVDHDGEIAGCAVWFLNFSTWLGRHGLYLEDLYVRPQHRRLGYGRLLLHELARLCVERGYGRLEWAVLDWNSPAIDFYETLKAEPMNEWTTYRLTGRALQNLGSQAGTERPGPVSDRRAHTASNPC